MAAYRGTPHESTGRSPNAIMFGRENCMPIDIFLGAPDSDDTIPRIIDDYVYNLHERQSKSYQLVCELVSVCQNRRRVQPGARSSSSRRSYFSSAVFVGVVSARNQARAVWRNCHNSII